MSAWSTAAHAAAAPGHATALRDHHRGVRAGVGTLPRAVQHLPHRGSAAAHTARSELAVSLRLGPAAVDRKIVALRAQASQTTALFAALGEEQVRQWWSTETFVAADAARDRTQERAPTSGVRREHRDTLRRAGPPRWTRSGRRRTSEVVPRLRRAPPDNTIVMEARRRRCTSYATRSDRPCRPETQRMALGRPPPLSHPKPPLGNGNVAAVE